jgi:hypothetical protein
MSHAPPRRTKYPTISVTWIPRVNSVERPHDSPTVSSACTIIQAPARYPIESRPIGWSRIQRGDNLRVSDMDHPCDGYLHQYDAWYHFNAKKEEASMNQNLIYIGLDVDDTNLSRLPDG